MPKKAKQDKVTPVEADNAEEARNARDGQLFDEDGRPIVETDWSKPISASNPPPSKRPLAEQGSPVSDGDTLQKDERGVDEELKESEEAVQEKTNSVGRRTRTTDTGADVGGDASDANNVSTTTSGRASTK